MQSKKQTISVALIVKNEAKMLDKCLKSIESLADEIIVTDTGSTDNTIETAKTYGAKISTFKWVNDFAAARNFALLQATCDYILVLDADETINFQDLEKIKNLLNTEKETAFSLPTRNYLKINDIPDCVPAKGEYNNEEEGYFGWVISDKVRLFPNKKQINFRNKIHEIVEPSILEANIPIVKADIPIHHFGYSKDADFQKEKAKMHEEILQEQIKLTPDNPKFHYDLGFILFKKEKYAEALPHFEKALALKNDYQDALFFKTKSLLKTGKTQEAILGGQKLIAENPDNSECYHLLGDIMLSLDNTTEALRNYKKAERLSPAHPEICLKISDILQKSDMPEKAMFYLKKAKESLSKL